MKDELQYTRVLDSFPGEEESLPARPQVHKEAPSDLKLKSLGAEGYKHLILFYEMNAVRVQTSQIIHSHAGLSVSLKDSVVAPL